MRLLVTGATGFIGRAFLARAVLDDTLQLRGAVRGEVHDLPRGVQQVRVGDLGLETDWECALSAVDAVVHAAGRAHVMRRHTSGSLAEFRRVNVAGTLNLARQAVAAGSRRFVFISSIGVNGAETHGAPFTADDEVAPHSPYAISKHEAEVGLRQVARETGLEVVIIRPPLVVGPGAPGNLGQLMRWLHHGVPLPLGAIRNQRSLVAVDNLVDLIMTCLRHPKAVNQTFLISDGEDVSTTQLLRQLSQNLGISTHLLPVPGVLLRAVAALFGKRIVAQALCGSLRVDISKTREVLDWSPPVTVYEGIRRAAHGV